MYVLVRDYHAFVKRCCYKSSQQLRRTCTATDFREVINDHHIHKPTRSAFFDAATKQIPRHGNFCLDRKFSTADPLVFHRNFIGLRARGRRSKQKFVGLALSLTLPQRESGRHNFGPLECSLTFRKL